MQTFGDYLHKFAVDLTPVEGVSIQTALTLFE